MKVCLVTSYYAPYVGGIETYVKNLGESLVSSGHEVTVYCSSRGSATGTIMLGGVKVVRFETPLVLYGAPLGPFPSSFFKEDYDVIHGNFPNPYFAALSAWTAELKGTPAVLTWHNDLPGVTRAASLLVGAHDLFSPTYLNLYGAIIATTSTYASRSRTLRKHWRRVRVVSNGVDTKRFAPGVVGSSVREAYGLRRDFVVLFVGALTRWHAYKGLDVLIEAFALASRSCQSMRLLVVGDGELREKYVSMARNFNLSERITFAGRVEDSQLPGFYAACDVTVLPSKDASEGFGLVLLEAMACGKAVVGTSVGGIPELVRSGENGLLVAPNDPEALAASLCALQKDEEGRLAMGRRGRVFAEARDWTAVATNVDSIYREIRSGR